jgi:hypothetical protein
MLLRIPGDAVEDSRDAVEDSGVLLRIQGCC